MPGSENKHTNGNGTRRGFDCSSLPAPVDRHSRVFSKTNTRWCARLAVGRGKFNLTGAMREHGRTNKESGARKETVFYARSFSCPNNYKEGCVGGYARAPLDVYKVWSKSSGEIFSWNCLFEGITRFAKYTRSIFLEFWNSFPFDYRYYSFVFSTCIVLFLFFFSHSSLSLAQIIQIVSERNNNKIIKFDREKVRLKWLIRCRDSVMLSLFRSSDLWSTDFFPLLRFSLVIRFES